ncbi:hypothetical protein YC2023_062884 [Brassica napus]
MDPWRAHRIRRAEKVLADRYMAYIRDEFLKEEEIDENDFPLEFSWERVCNRMLKMISITRKTMEEHKHHLDSFIGTWDEFGRPGGRGLVVFTVQEACLWTKVMIVGENKSTKSWISQILPAQANVG